MKRIRIFGDYFSKQTILLPIKIYLGILVFGRWRNENAHEAVISLGLWEKVRITNGSRARRRRERLKDTCRYYLRNAIHCSHRGRLITPAVHPGRTASVPYYECIRSFKRQSVGYPVQRINARTVQDSIFGEIERAAKHLTRMDELIREAVGRLPGHEGLPADLAAATRQLAAIDEQLGNLGQAGGVGGGQLRPRLARMEMPEAERLPLETKKAELYRAMEATCWERPSTERICRK